MKTKNAGNLEKGDYIDFKNAPHQVTKTEFMNPGKGSAIIRVRMRNVQSGSMAEYTYKSGENVEILDVIKKEMQYLYHDDKMVSFMDPKNYEQAEVPVGLLAESLGFLKEGLLCWTVWFEEKAIGVILPPHVTLKVVEAPEAVAGNRVNAPKKEVVLETGVKVLAPLFIKEGDVLEIDTGTGEYVARR